MKGNTNKFMKIHEITPKDYTDLHRLYCQLEDDWTSDIQDMIRVLEEVKDDPHYHLVGIFDDADKLVGTITLSKCLDLICALNKRLHHAHAHQIFSGERVDALN